MLAGYSQTVLMHSEVLFAIVKEKVLLVFQCKTVTVCVCVCVCVFVLVCFVCIYIPVACVCTPTLARRDTGYVIFFRTDSRCGFFYDLYRVNRCSAMART